MKFSRIAVIVSGSVLLLAVGISLFAIFPSVTLSQASSSFQFQSSLVGSSPSTPIDGIASGGAPWVVTAGEVTLSPHGMLTLTVVGLVLSIPGSPLDGTTGPVTSVLLSLICQGTGTVAASTSAVPLASNGNAHINQVISLPSSCVAPIILVRIAGTTTGPVTNGPWIAASGFTS